MVRTCNHERNEQHERLEVIFRVLRVLRVFRGSQSIQHSGESMGFTNRGPGSGACFFMIASETCVVENLSVNHEIHE